MASNKIEGKFIMEAACTLSTGTGARWGRLSASTSCCRSASEWYTSSEAWDSREDHWKWHAIMLEAGAPKSRLLAAGRDRSAVGKVVSLDDLLSQRQRMAMMDSARPGDVEVVSLASSSGSSSCSSPAKPSDG